jgi:pantoate--beta-alanine ligase
MQRIRTVADMHAWRRAEKAAGRSIAFVPTMGFLHEGHLTLCREARAKADRLVVSIFVNPLQFGPSEDLSRYPRDEAGDLVKLESVGVDVVFLPTPEEMYPPGFCTEVNVQGLTANLCGASRPTHFRGVATVVARLFNLVGPDRAYFGLKDYQQCLVIRRMVQDLGMDLEVIGVPTVREPDGLAMSSRNAYLTPEGRRAALVLSRSLAVAREAYAAGERDPVTLRHRVLETLAREPLAVVDYTEVVDAGTLQPASPDRPMLVALAVRIQSTRLIDNTVLGA